MNLEKIILDNEKLGVKTHFFYEDNGVLGYTENGEIYLNEFYNGDLEKVNKHEVLHLFEDSKQFLGVKKIVFNVFGEKELNRLRNEYSIKYAGLYNEEEIKNGILDNEIAIDIIVGNGHFNINVNHYVQDAYETIINQKESARLTPEGRRYLSLNVSKNTSARYSKLSKWDLLFANEYYKGKVKPVGEKRYEEIKAAAMSACDKLMYEKFSADFFIETSDNPYLERRLNEIIATYEAKGEYEEANKLKNNRSRSLARLSLEYENALYNQYLSLRELLFSYKYEDSFKYLILNEVLTKTYRYEKNNRIIDKREQGRTILPLMMFNEFILDEIHDNIDKYNNFSDLYFDALDKYNQEFLSDEKIKFAKSEQGCWIKFNQGQEGTLKFINDARNLGNLIRDTPWCTRKSPESQLKDGDFYVFVDNFNKPHVAVQLVGERINEVRGIKGGGDQEIEDEYRQTAIDFLKNNSSIRGAEEWLEKEIRNEILSESLIKIRKNELSDEAMLILIENLNSYEKRLHGHINSNEIKLIEEIANNKEIRNRIAEMNPNDEKVLRIIDEIERNNRILGYYEKIKMGILKEEECEQMYKDILYEFNDYKYEDNQRNLVRLVNSRDNVFIQTIAKKFNCNSNEIYVGRLEKNRGLPFEGDVCPYRVIVGDVDLINSRDLDLSNLVYVKGSVKLDWARNIDLSSLVHIEGKLDVVDTENINLQSLRTIGGDLAAYRFGGDLSNLKIICGNADFEWCDIKEFESIEEVFGDLKMSHYTEKMDKLRYVKGTIIWDKYSQMKDLPSLERCEWISGGPLEFREQFYSDPETDEMIRKSNKR